MNDVENHSCWLCVHNVAVEPAPEVILPGNIASFPDELIVTCRRCGKYRVPFALSASSSAQFCARSAKIVGRNARNADGYRILLEQLPHTFLTEERARA